MRAVGAGSGVARVGLPPVGYGSDLPATLSGSLPGAPREGCRRCGCWEAATPRPTDRDTDTRRPAKANLQRREQGRGRPGRAGTREWLRVRGLSGLMEEPSGDRGGGRANPQSHEKSGTCTLRQTCLWEVHGPTAPQFRNSAASQHRT